MIDDDVGSGSCPMTEVVSGPSVDCSCCCSTDIAGDVGVISPSQGVEEGWSPEHADKKQICNEIR